MLFWVTRQGQCEHFFEGYTSHPVLFQDMLSCTDIVDPRVTSGTRLYGDAGGDEL